MKMISTNFSLFTNTSDLNLKIITNMNMNKISNQNYFDFSQITNNNHFILSEFLTNGYHFECISVLSLISIIFGILIITAKNPIYSILFLIGLFVSISAYLMLLGLYFMGLAYLLVYVGAVSILFIFILMLINVRISELLTEGKNSIPLAILAVISFNFAVAPILSYSAYSSNMLSHYLYSLYKYIINYMVPMSSNNYVNNIKESITGSIANVSSNNWELTIAENNHISSIGNIMYTNLFMLLIITSLILLLAMVGTIVITVRKEKVINLSQFSPKITYMLCALVVSICFSLPLKWLSSAAFFHYAFFTIISIISANLLLIIKSEIYTTNISYKDHIRATLLVGLTSCTLICITMYNTDILNYLKLIVQNPVVLTGLLILCDTSTLLLVLITKLPKIGPTPVKKCLNMISIFFVEFCKYLLKFVLYFDHHKIDFSKKMDAAPVITDTDPPFNYMAVDTPEKMGATLMSVKENIDTIDALRWFKQIKVLNAFEQTPLYYHMDSGTRTFVRNRVRFCAREIESMRLYDFNRFHLFRLRSQLNEIDPISEIELGLGYLYVMYPEQYHNYILELRRKLATLAGMAERHHFDVMITRRARIHGQREIFSDIDNFRTFMKNRLQGMSWQLENDLPNVSVTRLKEILDQCRDMYSDTIFEKKFMIDYKLEEIRLRVSPHFR